MSTPQSTRAGRGRGRRTSYRLLLVNPRYPYKHYAAQDQLARLAGKRAMTPPLSLLVLAAGTPAHYEVRLVDEECEPLPLSAEPHLVGITTLSATSRRAQEIAAHYRKKGATVVLGGPYATFATDEALEHADAVVVGEAEGAWEALLADFEAGRLGRVYRAEAPVAGAAICTPRWELVNPRWYMTCGVETSRGCPFSCDFCMVHRLFGRKMRYREVDAVVAEIARLPVRRVFFTADNFTINKTFARALVDRFNGMDISWVAQSSIDVADDPDLLGRMARAGCTAVLIGFESLNAATLGSMHKGQNRIEAFDEAVRRVHAAGMHAFASFVIGYDTDTEQDFEEVLRFFERNDVLFGIINNLSVAPGTELFERVRAEGRQVVVEPSYRNGMFPCMRYEHFTQRRILDLYFDTVERLFDYDTFRQRAERLFDGGTFAEGGKVEVSFTERAVTFVKVLRRFVLTSDPARRALFRSLRTMARQGKVSMDQAMFTLLSVEGFQDFLRESRHYLPEIRKAVDDLGC